MVIKLPSGAAQALATALLLWYVAAIGFTQSSRNPAVLARDVDKRPLPMVTTADLSPAMRKEVQSLMDEAQANAPPEDKNRATPPSLKTTIYRIPVAPHGHTLYLVGQDGELACAPNGPNCPQIVLDETSEGVDRVLEDSGVGISVVRRPNLQMPDIASSSQIGHVSNYTTVYRFDGGTWHPYLCKEVPILDGPGGDPQPEVVADKPCTP